MPGILITIPVHNEALVLAENVNKLHAWCREHLSAGNWQIQIVENGSTDNTLTEAERCAASLPSVTVLSLPMAGKGRAIQESWKRSLADILVFMDADLATDLAALLLLISLLSTNQADLVVGSRYLPDSRVKRSKQRRLISRIYQRLVRLILRLPVSDASCGFKGIDREATKQLLPLTVDDHFFWDTELLGLAHAAGFRLREIPVQWVETRTPGRKSQVSVLRTSLNYLRNLIKLRKRMRLLASGRQNS
ncbi:glycosyltransferase [Candidatus Uhrbacteria bacterium]|nr:glycosyltransferase [Candidatus Uhrbacteria bacterium]